jgi:FtsX-like permease family
MSYPVAKQTAIGVRITFGAARSTVQWMVIREILLLACTGVLIGIPVPLIGARLVAALEDPHLLSMVLYDVSSFDPVSVGMALLLHGLRRLWCRLFTGAARITSQTDDCIPRGVARVNCLFSSAWFERWKLLLCRLKKQQALQLAQIIFGAIENNLSPRI